MRLINIKTLTLYTGESQTETGHSCSFQALQAEDHHSIVRTSLMEGMF